MVKNTRIVNNYRVIYKPDHPTSMTSKNWVGYVYEHRYLMELEYGRPLQRNELVHHLDGNVANNKLSNLIVLTRGHHERLHTWVDKGANYYGDNSPSQNNIFCGESVIGIGINSMESKEVPVFCIHCGSTLQKGQVTFCSNMCKYENNAKNVPPKEELEKVIGVVPYTQLGERYGVSDNAVRKWAKKYGLL